MKYDSIYKIIEKHKSPKKDIKSRIVDRLGVISLNKGTGSCSRMLPGDSC